MTEQNGTTSAPESASPILGNSITLERPEGVTDGRWSALASLATLVLTGHTPWCEDHFDDVSGRREDGWCSRRLTSFAAEVEITNGSTDGRVTLSIDPRNGVNLQELNVTEAAGVASVLDLAVSFVRLGNLDS